MIAVLRLSLHISSRSQLNVEDKTQRPKSLVLHAQILHHDSQYDVDDLLVSDLP